MAEEIKLKRTLKRESAEEASEKKEIASESKASKKNP